MNRQINKGKVGKSQVGVSEAGFLKQATELGQKKGKLTNCRRREVKPAEPGKSHILNLYKVAELPTLRFLREI